MDDSLRIACLAAAAREHGTPCFVYFLDDIRERVNELKRAFGERFHLSYAVKSNPNPELLRRLREHVHLLDVSSGGELERGLRTGFPAEALTFSGPGKRNPELEAAVTHRIGGIIVESVGEATRLAEIAARRAETANVLVRISPSELPPGFGVRMSGKPTPFGIDEEEIDEALAEILALERIRLLGLHIYSGTQCLRPEAIAENIGIHARIFRGLAVRHDLTPELLVFGSGFGIPYHEDDVPLDVRLVAEKASPVLDALREDRRFRATRMVLEMGRYLVGEAGFFLTRVVSQKRSRGTDICICDGGMNHHLGACGHLGSVIPRNYRMFKVSEDPTPAASQEYDLAGPLCTSIDTLGRRVKLPRLEVSDVIAIRSSGAYGVSASPIHFIQHPPPRELLIEIVNGSPVTRDVSEFR
jgi:diaminopimelate decarboxylase